MMDDALTCSVCAQDVPVAVAVGCARCGSPHHRDCWVFVRSCSRFGCGGRRSIPFRRLPQELVRGAIEIDRNAVVPDLYRKQLQAGLWRQQLEELGRSLSSGVKGGIAAALLAIFWLPPLQYFVMFFGIGVIFGILAPSLVPLQVRFPERMTMVSTGVLLGLCMLAANIPRTLPLLDMFVTAAIGVIAVTAGSSMAEWVLGRRQVLGHRLGSAATSLRYVFTGLGAGLAILVSLRIAEGHFLFRWIFDTAPFVVAAMLAGGHPLEKAKALLEEDWPPELPEGSTEV